MSISRDLGTYRGVFGKEKIVYSRTVTFSFKDNGKDRTLVTSLFLTANHVTVINTKENIKYRIPLGDILNFYSDKGVLKYYVHLEYGNQLHRYHASIDFTVKSEGQIFMNLLDLAIEVDKKRLDLERKSTEMNNEVNHWKQRINDLDTINQSLSEENKNLEYEHDVENQNLKSNLKQELNDVYSIKKALKIKENDLQENFQEKVNSFKKYKEKEMEAITKQQKDIEIIIAQLNSEKNSLL